MAAVLIRVELPRPLEACGSGFMAIALAFNIHALAG
jgi:hypothetical protein